MEKALIYCSPEKRSPCSTSQPSYILREISHTPILTFHLAMNTPGYDIYMTYISISYIYIDVLSLHIL